MEALRDAAQRMERHEATRVCNGVVRQLVLAMHFEDDGSGVGWHQLSVARDTSYLLPWLESSKAGSLVRELVTVICSDPIAGQPWTNEGKGSNFRELLGTLLGDNSNPARTHREVPAGFPSPLSEPAPSGVVDAKRSPERLTSQELVELLKMPTCIAEARQAVLDHLGNRYGRRFFNHWDFVRFAKEQHLNLDLTTPPKRPDPKESHKRMLKILDAPDQS
jgi:hypothetical protein